MKVASELPDYDDMMIAGRVANSTKKHMVYAVPLKDAGKARKEDGLAPTIQYYLCTQERIVPSWPLVSQQEFYR